ncbi:aspartate aminotransferase family protein [Streptomyces sp. NPDC020951]|uniref:aspartate aminotransferase family protein n=1 Tax=Streptomyces sp. NPDC020951 TaxID=3365104 RepID=UPI0037AB5DA8
MWDVRAGPFARVVMRVPGPDRSPFPSPVDPPAPDSALPDASLGAFRLPDELSFVIAAGAGSRIRTTRGRELIDLVMSCGPLVLGHAHPRVVEAVERQLRDGTTYYYLNASAARLAQRIVELVPCADAVKFCASGSDATFSALRLARRATGRDMILKFDGGYLGSHDYGRAVEGPACGGVPAAVAADVLHAPFNDLAQATRVAEAHRERLAAIIVEPVQRAIEPAPGFLAGLRAVCNRIGAVLVFDEVVTGFRLALGGAQELYGVIPDLCALGKALGGGLPIGAVAGRRELIELAAARPIEAAARSHEPEVYVSGSTLGNPLSCAAGLATLRVLEDEDGISRMAESGRALRERLLDVAAEFDVELQVIGPGAFIEPVFGPGPVVDQRSYEEQDRVASRAFGLELIRAGVFAYPGFKMYLSTAHDQRDLDEVADRARAAMRRVRDDGLLRGQP